MKLLLDTGVLGRICHPRRHPEAKTWLAAAALVHEVALSEVADYELRRELVRIGSRRSLARLDELGRELVYVPVTTATWRTAARLWAIARTAGRPGASADALDGDVLVAAQALAQGATVVTTNPKHFTPFVDALDPSDVPVSR